MVHIIWTKMSMIFLLGKVPRGEKKMKNGLMHRNQHPKLPQNSSGKRMLKVSFLKSWNHTIKLNSEYNFQNQNI